MSKGGEYMDKKRNQTRTLTMEIQKRADDGTGDLFLEGYFAVFDAIYELWPGATESIKQGAFSDRKSVV